ncbi:MAG: hypothetical protein IKA88_04170, partial [Clostridia bacterium]|nr:hypothetical protein [Clostridia bacterium]
LSLFDESGNVYRNECTVATQVLTDESDLAVFNLTQEKPVVTGYYVLGADIGTAEAPYNGMTHAGVTSSYYFNGTLNGNGHTLYVKGSKSGLFGRLGQTAVIENVAIHGSMAKDDINARRYVLADYPGSSTIKNCYFTLTDLRTSKTTALNLINEMGAYTVLTNVVVEYKAGCGETMDSGLLFNSEAKKNNIANVPTYYTNVYVIAPKGLPIAKINSTSTSVYASNEGKTADTANGIYVYPTKAEGSKDVTVVRYENTLALKNAGLDHSAFSASVWDTSYGIPVWNTLEKEYVATVDGVAAEEVNLSLDDTQDNHSAQLGIALFGLPCADVTFEIVSGAETIELSNSGVVTAVAEGTATVVAKLGAVEKQFTVEVVFPVEEYAETIAYFSAMDGVYINANGQETSLATIFGASANIVKAETLDGTELTVTDNKLTGLQAAAATYTAMQEVTVVLYSETKGYQVTLQVYTKVLNDSQDLTVFDWVSGVDSWAGYYIFSNDITADSSIMNTHKGMNNSSGYGFKGIVEGNQKTVSYYHGGYGLFGRLTGGAVIQNIRLEGHANGGTGASAMLAIDGGNAYSDRYTVQNVYLTITDGRASATANSSVMQYKRTYGTFENVLVERKTAYDAKKADGALFSKEILTGTDFTGNQAKMKNVFLVDSGEEVVVGIRTAVNAYYYASNEGKTTNNSTVYVYDGLYRYKTLAETAGSAAYSAMTNAAWVIQNGAFAWKK